jgi:D-glycero-alpha-D-manno-heptose-7-phosphate kinase
MDKPRATLAAGLVVTRTPLRLSFAGGGTDLAAFYETGHGAVVSTTIDKYVYVTVKRHGDVFDERIRLNYSVSEAVTTIEAIRNNIIRECLRLLEIDFPIYVSVVSDLPDSSGLGGSSAFAVGLLNALHALRKERVSPAQVAEEACRVEIEMLGEPIGKQDQYAAAYGGMNLMRFESGGAVNVEPLQPPGEITVDLFENLIIAWTGHQRRANVVLAEQASATPQHFRELVAMREQAFYLHGLLRSGSLTATVLGDALSEGWSLKRGLASAISNEQVDGWYARALDAGALGGKLCGAGAGGFLLFVVPPDRQQQVRTVLPELAMLTVGYEPRGTQVLLPLD